MSYLFDGTDDYIEQDSTTYAETTERTVVVWIKPDSFGQGARGRVWSPHISGNRAAVGLALLLDDINLVDGIGVISGRDNTDGYWGAASTVPTGFTDWIGIAVKYDGALTANDPEIWTRDVANSETALTSRTVTEVQAPVGAEWDVDRYLIGNHDPSTNIRAYDGRISHVQVFNRLLSETEMNAALDDPGSVTSGLILHQRLDDDTLDDGPNGWDATASGATLDGEEPPIGGGGPELLSVAGTVTPTGVVSELAISINSLAGVVTPTGALTAQKLANVFPLSVAGSVAPTGALFTVKNPSAGGSGFPMRFLQPRSE